MSVRTTALRAFQSAALSALFLAPAITPAAKAPGPPTDLTGTWTGKFEAVCETGTISLTFAQTGDSGTITGTAMLDSGGSINMTAYYTMDHRKLIDSYAAGFTLCNGYFADITGKASKTSADLKLTIKDEDTLRKTKVTLTRPK